MRKLLALFSSGAYPKVVLGIQNPTAVGKRTALLCYVLFLKIKGSARTVLLFTATPARYEDSHFRTLPYISLAQTADVLVRVSGATEITQSRHGRFPRNRSSANSAQMPWKNDAVLALSSLLDGIRKLERCRTYWGVREQLPNEK